MAVGWGAGRGTRGEGCYLGDRVKHIRTWRAELHRQKSLYCSAHILLQTWCSPCVGGSDFSLCGKSQSQAFLYKPFRRRRKRTSFKQVLKHADCWGGCAGETGSDTLSEIWRGYAYCLLLSLKWCYRWHQLVMVHRPVPAKSIISNSILSNHHHLCLFKSSELPIRSLNGRVAWLRSRFIINVEHRC